LVKNKKIIILIWERLPYLSRSAQVNNTHSCVSHPENAAQSFNILHTYNISL
jgi:hypothetical protein